MAGEDAGSKLDKAHALSVTVVDEAGLLLLLAAAAAARSEQRRGLICAAGVASGATPAPAGLTGCAACELSLQAVRRRRLAAKPTLARPAPIKAQPAGSGTAETSPSNATSRISIRQQTPPVSKVSTSRSTRLTFSTDAKL